MRTIVNVGSLQREAIVPLGAGGVVRLGRLPALSLRCHLHVNGRTEPVLLPLEFGT